VTYPEWFSISGAAWRRAQGFTEEDAPTDEEVGEAVERILTKPAKPSRPCLPVECPDEIEI
jgi:predicted aldo/keto reductase-like oxidoreductase